MLRKIVGSILSLTLVLNVFNVAYADQVEQKEVSIIGGSLRSNQSRIVFNDLTLDVKRSQTVSGKGKVLAIDDRGNDRDWSIGLSVTDFKLKKTVDGEEIEVVIPASAIKVTATNSKVYSGPEIDFTRSGNVLAKDKPLSTSTVSLIDVGTSQGNGAYLFDLDYNLTLPRIVRTSDGKEIGTMSGTYIATFTYSQTIGQ
jgi:hypothetical protein